MKQAIWVLCKIVGSIKFVLDAISEVGDWLLEGAEFTLDFFHWGVIALWTFENGFQWGYVIYLDKGEYQFKYTYDINGKRVYYVLIDGEWVKMPEDWAPGKPLSPEEVT